MPSCNLTPINITVLFPHKIILYQYLFKILYVIIKVFVTVIVFRIASLVNVPFNGVIVVSLSTLNTEAFRVFFGVSPTDVTVVNRALGL